MYHVVTPTAVSLYRPDDTGGAAHSCAAGHTTYDKDLVGNFYIYSLTLSSFREFLKSIMKMISAPLMKCWAGTEGELS